MLNRIKNHTSGLNKTLVLNMISTILLQGISFFTVPIFSRVLGSEQYGIYSIFISWVSIFSTFISLNISSSIASGKYKFQNDYCNYRDNTFMYTVIISLLISILCVLLFPIIKKFIEYDILLYVIMILTAFSSVVLSSISTILIYDKKALLKLVLSLVLSLGSIILSLFFIFVLKITPVYIGRVYGHFLPYMISSIIVVSYILFNRKITYSLEYLRFGILYGLPLIGHSLAGVLLGQADRIMMNKMSIISSYIGIYSLYYSFVSVLNIVLGAFNTSFIPFSYEDINSNNINSLIKKTKNYIEVFTVACLGFLLLSREVSYIMANAEYREGIELIPIFVLIVYSTFLYYFPANQEFYYGKTKYIAIGTMSATIINIILNYFFIMKMGMYGAAIASLISNVFMFIFHYCIANHLSNTKYYYKIEYFALSVLMIIIFVIVFYMFKEQVILRWLIAIILGLFELYRIYLRKSIF